MGEKNTKQVKNSKYIKVLKHKKLKKYGITKLKKEELNFHHNLKLVSCKKFLLTLLF